MNSEIQRRFDVIESQRAAIESNVLALNDAQLNWKTGNDWNIREIVQHLVLSDETVGQAQEAGKAKQEGLMFRIIPRTWRLALITGALNRDMTLPVPSSELEPCEDIPLTALLSRWERQRNAMRLLLETTVQDNGMRYSHPVLGPLTIDQVLYLGQVHTAYHMRQMEAITRIKAFPDQEHLPEFNR